MRVKEGFYRAAVGLFGAVKLSMGLGQPLWAMGLGALLGCVWGCPQGSG